MHSFRLPIRSIDSIIAIRLMKKQPLVIILFHFLFFLPGFAQVPQKAAPINFFLDCWQCDFDYVRQNLDFVSFVRDPNLADVHILSSSSRTGSGGRKYYLNFIGRNSFTGTNYEYTYSAGQHDTDDEIRNSLLKLIKTGVVQYYSQSDYFDQINIGLADTDNRKALQIVEDPWKKWIFRIEAGSDYEKEESQNEFSLRTEINIEKVTEEWKTQLEGDYDIDRENYFDEGNKIINRQSRKSIRGEYIKSLTEKWSAGIFSGYFSDTYINVNRDFGVDAAIEYNIFPWDISNRKVFTFRYITGVSARNYLEKTIYNKTNEILFNEALELNLELVQPWGRIESRLQGRHYFHDFSKNRLTFDSELSVRLTRQLSVYSELQFEVVHDQLYLPAGGASLEDVLLRRRKLATNYELRAEFGFSFTFGSIYSNVVNERL